MLVSSYKTLLNNSTICAYSYTYGALGNPLSYYNGSDDTFTWTRGRRLASAAVNGHNVSYQYDANGIRVSKMVDGVLRECYYYGNLLMYETMPSLYADGVLSTIEYMFDADGNPTRLRYFNGLSTFLGHSSRSKLGDIIMKTRIIICCCVLLAVVLIVGIIINSVFKKTNVKSFSLNDDPYYLQAIQDFPSDKYLGEVLTAKEAQEKAIKEWLELFGDKINNEKPYQVFFDEQNSVWLVKGSLPKGKKGGVAYILIQKSDGKILAIWHDQ